MNLKNLKFQPYIKTIIMRKIDNCLINLGDQIPPGGIICYKDIDYVMKITSVSWNLAGNLSSITFESNSLLSVKHEILDINQCNHASGKKFYMIHIWADRKATDNSKTASGNDLAQIDFQKEFDMEQFLFSIHYTLDGKPPTAYGACKFQNNIHPDSKDGSILIGTTP